MKTFLLTIPGRTRRGIPEIVRIAFITHVKYIHTFTNEAIDRINTCSICSTRITGTFINICNGIKTSLRNMKLYYDVLWLYESIASILSTSETILTCLTFVPSITRKTLAAVTIYGFLTSMSIRTWIANALIFSCKQEILCYFAVWAFTVTKANFPKML